MNDTDLESKYTSEVHGVAFYVYYYGMFIIITCVNIPGNILVIRTVIKNPHLRQPCNLYIVSLAVTDLLVGIVYPVYNIAHLEHVPEVSRPLGRWSVCRFLVTEVLALGIICSYHLVAITVTRYVAIVYPLRYHLYITTKSTKYTIFTIWALSQCVCIIMYTFYNREEYIEGRVVCRYELIFSVTHVIIFLIIQLFLPLLIMLTLYIRIVKIARSQAKIIALQERVLGNRSLNSSNNFIRQELKSTVMVSVLLGFYIMAWTPLTIYFFYQITCATNCYDSSFIRATCRILLFMNSAVNVFIYAGRLPEFRKSIRLDITKLHKILCSCGQKF
ncbi:melanocortin receptor 3-like [Saccostrea echinata]|uniref:melanocortin receptor 3-like n=1 Tax=Saccostrea echinata TaxID=191078 RepID=UPI002A7F23CB|nr:melanocortin receptor 3-like [Saccostrea echinata]